MAGASTASSTSKAAATPRPSACRRGRAGNLRHHPALRHGAGECRAARRRRARFRRRQPDREYALRLSARFHPQCLGERAGRPPEKHHHADGRRLWRAAADRKADPGAGNVPLPVRLYRQGRRHRKGRDRAAGDLLHLFRRALHAAPPFANTAICCATSSPGTASIAGWSTPAGPAAPTAPAGACRSPRRAPC